MKWAGRYTLLDHEITIAEYLKTLGHATGHFGICHVEGFSEIVHQSEFPGGPIPYFLLWDNGFEECFGTESMIPTYNPHYLVSADFGTDEHKYVQSEPIEYGQQTGCFEWKDL